MSDLTLRHKVDALIELIESRTHHKCDDCWYSCAASTGDDACCNEDKAGGPCNCGRDAMIEKAHKIRDAEEIS